MVEATVFASGRREIVFKIDSPNEKEQNCKFGEFRKLQIKRMRYNHTPFRIIKV